MSLQQFLRMAKQKGCPADQVRNFRRYGYAPQPKQLQFHAAAREADKPDGPTMVAQGGSRGGAKSHAAICQVALDDCIRYPGLKWLYLRSVGSSARESFEDFLKKALPVLAEYYAQTRSVLSIPNGSRILLGGFRNERDIDKYIGLEYDGIVIDDAHLVSASKHDKIRGSLRTSKLDWRPRAYLTFNPGGIGHSYLKRTFVEPWRLGNETDTRFVFSLPEDNKFINAGYLTYLDSLTGWLKQAWRWGEFDIAAGQFFTTWRHDVHVIEQRTLRMNWVWWCAMDYGFTHPTTVYLLSRDEEGNVYVVDEHWEQKWLVPRHAEAIKAMLARNGLEVNNLNAFVAGGDVFNRSGASTTTPAEQYAEHGIELARADMDRPNGAAQVLSLLGDVDAKVKPRLFVFDRCARLVECIPAMQHDPNRPEDVLKTDVDEDGSGGDDPYDALRYGLMELRRLVISGVRVY